jgi:membrane associated rhomboid family serine protease
MVDGDGEVVARVTTEHAVVRDWALVLSAVGVPCRIERGRDGWGVLVAPGELARANQALADWDADVATRRPPPSSPPEYGSTLAGLTMAAGLVIPFRLAGGSDAGGALFRAGRAHAGAIVDGEAWRAVTALTLHADQTHILGNLALGAIVATAVCRLLGPGVGAWGLLVSGAVGNWVTAHVRGSLHTAVGASTAIFGGIGILAGLEVVRRPRRSWVPLAAGLALLGLLGTSDRSDLTAHFFGFVAGIVTGALVAPWSVVRTRPMQWLLALAAFGVVAGSWWLAARTLSPALGG